MTGRFKAYIRKNQKYAPVVFFMLGFLWDTLTLGRIDRLYDRSMLSIHLFSLTVSLYMFNVVDDGKWKNTFLEKYEEYFPLAIQFFLGALCSAFVIYSFRSVSITKTMSFFIILVILLFANELLKKRISNKYLQFSAYFFVNFTYFIFFIPVLFKQMGTLTFVISGVISLLSTLMLIIFIYNISPSTRAEIHRGKMIGLITGIYLMINTFYFFNLIPPVPVALETGLVAYNIEKSNDQYIVTYEDVSWWEFWSNNSKIPHSYTPDSNVYVFTSIFAPTGLKENVNHRWKWFNPTTKAWEVTDVIGFEITGGRNDGYRGYTHKGNMSEGKWKVDVITENGLVIGIINFDVIMEAEITTTSLITESF